KKRQIQLVPAAPKPDPDAERKRQFDATLYAPQKKPFEVEERFKPQIVPFSGYPAGTIVVDTTNKYLYLVEGWGKARRYGIAVGQQGLEFKGTAVIRDKQEWPRWIPTKSMIERQPEKYARYKDGMDGGP